MLGQQIKVYTDHKNLTYKTFNTERVMKWRLILEEYKPELIYYIQGSKNIGSGAFNPNMSLLVEHFSLEQEEVLHPVNYKTIMRYHQNNKYLIGTAKSNKDYSIKHFNGADKKYSLICTKYKIGIPKLIEKQVVEWYHNALCHSGETSTELSIAQQFYWKKLPKTVYDVCSRYKACQFLKRNKKQYGK